MERAGKISRPKNPDRDPSDNTLPKYLPSFDGRVVIFPSDQNLKDYLSWRQTDVHVNNLYNTAFWSLVEKGYSKRGAAERLKGTVSEEKKELLIEFGINYNDLSRVFRKGTILLRYCLTIPKTQDELVEINSKNGSTKTDEFVKRLIFVPLHEDMTNDQFWEDHPELLGKYISPEFVEDTSGKESGTYKILEHQHESGYSELLSSQ